MVRRAITCRFVSLRVSIIKYNVLSDVRECELLKLLKQR